MVKFYTSHELHPQLMINGREALFFLEGETFVDLSVSFELVAGTRSWKVRAFEDNWGAFTEIPEFFEELAAYAAEIDYSKSSATALTVDEMKALLLRLGYKESTR